jgi:hypothetical protein
MYCSRALGSSVDVSNQRRGHLVHASGAPLVSIATPRGVSKGAKDGLGNDAHLSQDARDVHDDGAQFAMGAIPRTFHSFDRQVS